MALLVGSLHAVTPKYAIRGGFSSCNVTNLIRLRGDDADKNPSVRDDIW